MKKLKLLVIGILFASILGWFSTGSNLFAEVSNNQDQKVVQHDPSKKLPKENWVPSWNASPEPTWGPEFPFPTKIPNKMKQQTIRQIARISVGGDRVRIVLSNEYGKKPLKIGEVHVALTDHGSKVVQKSDKKLTFSGKTSVVVPAGAPIMSDPVDLKVNPLAKVTISLYLPEETEPTTFHWDARQTTYIANGNVTSATDVKASKTTDASMFLSGILVDAPKNKGTVVTIGDSITDGNGATVDANTRWPDFLAKRLLPYNYSVINAGISGNRLLRDGMGVNAIARFDRDVLSKPNVKSVIVLVGINDISWPGTEFAPHETRPTFEELITGYRQLIARAHARNIKVIGVTLTPFEGALTAPDSGIHNYHSKDKDQLRQKLNNWIRSGEFDFVVDLDAVMKDPKHPTRLLPKYDSGDHLHPGDLGNQKFADSIDLNAIVK